MDEPVRPGPARVVPIREPVQLLAERWRELSQRWAQQHAPTTSYGRLCRCAELEVSDVERSHIRKDIRRSRPDFFCTYAPEDLDLTFHAAKLERVLCAWAVYDIEIGYVQAMNLLGSTLLMLLEGDEEAAFWVLVTLLRQLPHEFYSRAPLQLLGFWVEVEVLVQLADRLLGLRGLRGALLQITPRWLLEFWVGTLPLGSLLLVWDHLLRYAPTQGTPSTFNLQVALALLELLQPQVSRHLSERMDDVQAVYSRLAGMRLPDGDGSWLLQSALDVLHPATHRMPLWRTPSAHPRRVAYSADRPQRHHCAGNAAATADRTAPSLQTIGDGTSPPRAPCTRRFAWIHCRRRRCCRACDRCRMCACACLCCASSQIGGHCSAFLPARADAQRAYAPTTWERRRPRRS